MTKPTSPPDPAPLSGANPEPSPIDHAVHDACRHLNRGVVRHMTCWSALIGGGTAMALGLMYAVQGLRVPLWIYGVSALAAAIVFLVGCWRRWSNHQEAAGRLDERFRLADGVNAARTFGAERREGGFYALQKQWAERAVSKVQPEALRPRLSRRLAAAALVLPLLAVLLGFRPPSDAILEAERQAAATLQLGQELNHGIREEVKRHLDEAEELERELLDPESLKELAERLETSEQRADLMRQYAEMEQELAERSLALQQKRAERLMDEAASRLSENASSMALAEALRQKRYDDAAALLKKKQPDPKADAKTQRAQLEKLKAAASHLGQAAKSFKASAGSSGANPSARDLADEMATLSEQLDAAARDYDNALKKALDEANKNDKLDDATKKKLSDCQGQCNASNRELQKKLQQLSAFRKASLRLNQMRRTLSQCQGACAGQCQSPFAQKKAGAGSVDSLNNQFTPEDGQLDAITGVKSAGPSQTTIEEASSGAGVSGRRGAAPAAEHARQLESFVDRPDVPESLKEGVKTYFESLPQTPEETLAP